VTVVCWPRHVACQFSCQFVVNSRANLWYAFYRGLLVASRGQVLGITVVLSLAFHASVVKMDPTIVGKVIRSEKGKDFLALKFSSSVSEKFLLTKWNDGVVLTQNVNVMQVL